MFKKIFVTGISTDVGKSIVAAIITEALEADYWKPIQAGDLEHCDSHKVKTWISNPRSVIYPNQYALKSAMSPHAAAEIDDLKIELHKIQEPQTTNHLVIEGAGGLLVPLNDTDTILDLIQPTYKVIVVCRHYLGSINHSLLTLQLLIQKGFEVSVIFNGNKNQATESIIQKMTGVNVIGRINEEAFFDKKVIKKYADLFKKCLFKL